MNKQTVLPSFFKHSAQAITLLLCASFSLNTVQAGYVNKDHQTCRALNNNTFNKLYPDAKLVQEQTFSLNLPNFGESCFLTLYQAKAERTSFLLTATDGSIRYQFDTIKNSALGAGCKLLAVGFEDVNSDKQMDIIAVNQCQTSVGNYNYNNLLIISTATTWQVDNAHSQAISRYKTFADIRLYLRDYPPAGTTKPSNNFSLNTGDKEKFSTTTNNADKISSEKFSSNNKPNPTPETTNPSTNSNDKTDKTKSGESNLSIRGELEFDSDGFSLLSSEETNTIYLLKRYPKRLDEQRNDFVGKSLLITGRILNTEQKGALIYKTIDALDVKVE
ncbi:hypothetical protein BegalDRAFT_0358 [Beggiatoa alba B18LD]|uniref:FG-GAP repeat protein n=1 Tax=Beggiatoa alba B18LD TaxID=395493 RepID=I3CCD5_9GAMM|nr:hypothetical protein [Beggiatoa alba]EIJ41278.1 hypothetical protein BegalDRAFT_0358 [Beggiatoa alba B18LD]